MFWGFCAHRYWWTWYCTIAARRGFRAISFPFLSYGSCSGKRRSWHRFRCVHPCIGISKRLCRHCIRCERNFPLSVSVSDWRATSPFSLILHRDSECVFLREVIPVSKAFFLLRGRQEQIEEVSAISDWWMCFALFPNSGMGCLIMFYRKLAARVKRFMQKGFIIRL